MKKIKVLVIEDSPVAQRLLKHVIHSDPQLQVVGCAEDAEQAMAMIKALEPDVVTMDIRLPRMNGFELTRRIMREAPLPIVVVASNVDDRALDISMNALKAGALTVIEKPSALDQRAYEALARDLCGQLVNMSQVKVIRQRAERCSRSAAAPVFPPVDFPQDGFDMVGIVASTGGPGALARIAADLPPDYPLPIVVVQHIGSVFVAAFAAWLGTVSRLPVGLAEDGARMRPGRIHVAPGGAHLRVSGGEFRLEPGPPLRGPRPAGDVLFDSLARSHGRRGIGVLLTGMGEDGARGLAAMRNAGAHTIAEDASTAVIWGMPGVAVKLGAAKEQLPVDAIGARLCTLAGLSVPDSAPPGIGEACP